jgi:hypothetical protein
MTQIVAADYDLREIDTRYRAAKLSQMYYGVKLARWRTIHTWMDVAIAVGTTGSGVASLAIWQGFAGQYVWLFISGIATVLATIKPGIDVAGRIDRYSNLQSSLGAICVEFEDLISEINRSLTISSKSRAKYSEVRKRMRQLKGLEVPLPDANLVRQLQVEVDAEPTWFASN